MDFTERLVTEKGNNPYINIEKESRKRKKRV